jgi:hypothetical protein
MGSFILEHFHPMQCALLRNAPRRMAHPEYDLRVAPGEGMVIRELTSQPFCFDPSFFAEMAGFGPCDHFDRVISVPCTTASVEPLCKRLEFYNTEYCLDETRLSNLGSWWRFFGNPGSVHYSKMVAPISIEWGIPFSDLIS